MVALYTNKFCDKITLYLQILMLLLVQVVPEALVLTVIYFINTPVPVGT